MRNIDLAYTFNHAAKTITFTNLSAIQPEFLISIIDVTNNSTLYQANLPGFGGAFSTNVLTLQVDTTGSGFANTDKLQIMYEGATATTLQDAAGNVVNTLSAGAGQNGLMIALGATNYVISTANSSTAQLAANATFTGAIETIFNEPAISVLLTCDQPGTLTINQYIDAGGVFKTGAIIRSVAANAGLQESFAANGNYVNITFQNTGASTTTTFNLNVAYGNIDSVDSTGSKRVTVVSAPLAPNAAQETGGNLAAIATNTAKIPAQGQALAASSTPVVLPASQITTLTPPAAITNYAQETGGNLAAIAISEATTAANTGQIDQDIILLRRIVKLLEASGNMDGNQRQRIVLDAITAGLTLAAVTTVSTVTSVTNVAAIAGLDQRQWADQSRINYSEGIRRNLAFS